LACPHCGTTCAPEHKFCPGCAFPIAKLREQADDPLIGRTLPGGHVVLELIDVGGMGRVYRAEQKMLGRTVAVKIVHPHLLGDEAVEARFITEARAPSKLNHPNSVGVIDFGKFEGRFYMVMEFLRGRDLATVAHQEGPLSVERIVGIMTQALAALEEAHHHGIVHRDLKPENIVLEALRSGGDFVKVLDFGLAKVREVVVVAESPQKKRITGPGMVCGTPEYMAPEQVRGDTIDHRADLYACGVLLFELLTGRLPFDAPTPNEIVLMHLSSLPPDPRNVAPQRKIPPELADVVVQTLSKEPSERPQSAGELASALDAAIDVGEARERRRSGELVRCEACSAAVPRTQKFCGDCGGQMKRRRTTPPPNDAAGFELVKNHADALPLTAREEELDWLFERRAELGQALHAVCISGPAGFGKSRLLTEFLRELERRGDVVTSVAPDPWWCDLGYHALREAIVQLADLPHDGGKMAGWAGATPEARAGLSCIFQSSSPSLDQAVPARRWSESPPQTPHETSQRLLVAEALRWALGVAFSRTDEGQAVVLAIDDLHAVDGASRSAFADVIADPPLVQALIVATHHPGFTAPDWEAAQVWRLQGLPTSTAAALIESGGRMLSTASRDQANSSATMSRVAPLYVDQLLRFKDEGGATPPPGLADLIAARVERLGAEACHLLQAIAVLGDAAAPAQLVALLPEVSDFGRQLNLLRQAGFVVTSNAEHGVSHPLVRDVVLASTPREVRRALHSRARRDFGVDELQIPAEAHALHAYHAGETFQALMLLEAVAKRAHSRADQHGAIKALRLGLDLARREMARGELEDPLGAVLIFACKLGDALADAGLLNDAEGVLREALGLAGPNASERPRILASLAAVARDDGRDDIANAHLDEALRIAQHGRRDELVTSLERMREDWAE